MGTDAAPAGPESNPVMAKVTIATVATIVANRENRRVACIRGETVEDAVEDQGQVALENFSRPVRIEHRTDDSHQVVGAETQQIDVTSRFEARRLGVERTDLLVLLHESLLEAF